MRKFIVTGGAGFIGVNTCRRVLESGDELVVVDNLSRPGAEGNLVWLKGFGDFSLARIDVRDTAGIERLLREHRQADVLIHLAGQVAVTTSVMNPREDFDTNALGALNILEAVRQAEANPLIIYASTNKVYGGMERVAVVETATRYAYRDFPHGISETAPLDFHSPYGCSKGAADQYVHDYARIYGLRTVVYRQSCIYGPRQFGMEDQGWVAWFVIAALLGKPITIYGNGKQVRDLLYIDDLVDAFMAAVEQPDHAAGQIYNVGGGPDRTLSVWAEFGSLLEELMGQRIVVDYGEWRPGDQPIYVSDIRKIEQDLHWHPQTSVREGIGRLVTWVQENRDLF